MGLDNSNPDYLIKNPFSIFEDANLTFSDLLKIKIDAVGLGKKLYRYLVRLQSVKKQPCSVK